MCCFKFYGFSLFIIVNTCLGWVGDLKTFFPIDAVMQFELQSCSIMAYVFQSSSPNLITNNYQLNKTCTFAVLSHSQCLYPHRNCMDVRFTVWSQDILTS